MSEQSSNSTDRDYGKIDITPTAIAAVAHHAVKQSYGIVGMASKGMVDGIAQLLSRDPHKGIEVKLTDELFEIDLYVIVENGIRIKAVAEEVQKSVKFHVEKAMDRPLDAVNVYIQGLSAASNSGS